MLGLSGKGATEAQDQEQRVMLPEQTLRVVTLHSRTVFFSQSYFTISGWEAETGR